MRRIDVGDTVAAGVPVIAIPKSGNAAHVRQNAAAALRLSAEDLAELDRALPPPGRKQRLAML